MAILSTISPGLWLLLSGLLLPWLPRALRAPLAIALPVFAIAHIWYLPDGTHWGIVALGHEFALMHIHPFTRIFATAFCIAMIGGGLFASTLLHSCGRRTTEVSAALVYGGAAISVTFAGDLITLLLFWEVMAIASTIIVWSSTISGSRRAGLRYAAMHFFGGLLMLEGVSLYVANHSDVIAPLVLDVAQLSFPTDLGAIFILLGVMVNLAAPPFSAWLADTYPKASPSGAIFLSAITTKTAVYVALSLFPGLDWFLYIGIFMIFYGIIFAMLENDIRKILSYSIVNQVGFMVTAIGIGTPFALLGAAAHAFCHIIYKALLMMSAGSVIEMTGKHKCTELGGLYHTMRLTTICGTIGALAISGFPLTSGFISKSIINDAAAQGHMLWVWLGLMAASAGVFLHAGIKYPWFVFFQRDSGLRPKDPPLPLKIGMVLFAALCILPGIWPESVYHMLPTLPDYEPNTLSHFVSQLQLLLFSGLAFFLLLPWLQRTNTISLDFDWLYRCLGLRFALYLEWVWNSSIGGIHWVLHWAYRTARKQIEIWHGPGGIFARAVNSGIISMWVGILLGLYLLLYFVRG